MVRNFLNITPLYSVYNTIYKLIEFQNLLKLF